MERTDFDQYFQERYKDQVQWYDRKATANKRLYLWFQWSLIILSSALPVLIALDNVKEGVTILLAIVLAIVTAGLKTFKIQETWVGYRTIAETLKKEEYFFTAQVGEYGRSSDREALFVERVESLISQENSTWVVNRSKTKSEERSG